MSEIRVDSITDEVGTSSPDFPNGILKSSMPSGSVIQVVQVSPSPTQLTVGIVSGSAPNLTSSNTTLVFSASITPSSASNKILILFRSAVDADGRDRHDYISLFRGSTFVSGTYEYRSSNTLRPITHVINSLDSPNTTSTVTYDLRAAINSGGQGGAALSFNTDNNSASNNSVTSGTSLILMEVAA